MEITLRRLGSKDDRTQFSSGDIDLDRFFQRYAGQNQFRNWSLDDKLRKRLPDYPLPILRIARLAVDQNFQGHGIGKRLLGAMLRLALQMRDQVGCVGIVVDAKPDAVSFYRKLGFDVLEIMSGELGDRPEPTPMFLPVKLLAKLAE